jgi:hypothetical protein
MGWLSDSLFGKKKRIDQNKINDYMVPYNNMLNEQEDIARQMMNPDSMLNMRQKNMLSRQNFDLLGQQNQNLLQNAYMTNMSPAQMMAQQSSQNNQNAGMFGQQMGGLMQNQYSMGNQNLQSVMQMRQGEGERLSNMHIQQVNASNAARQSRMGFASSLLGMGLNFGANFIPKPTAGGGAGGGGSGP